MYDSLSHDHAVTMEHGALHLDNQPPHSVKLIKIIDTSIPAAAPSFSFQISSQAKVGEEVQLSAIASKIGVPALASHWDFGDGVVSDGAIVSHTYTAAGNYTVRFTAEGLDGKSAEKTFSIVVGGSLVLQPPRRYSEPGSQ
jgi:PKD repeat protein